MIEELFSVVGMLNGPGFKYCVHGTLTVNVNFIKTTLFASLIQNVCLNKVYLQKNYHFVNKRLHTESVKLSYLTGQY